MYHPKNYIQYTWPETMTTTLDKSQYCINEVHRPTHTHSQPSQNLFYLYPTMVAVVAALCCACTRNPHSSYAVCFLLLFTTVAFVNCIHTFLKLQMIQSKSSWFAWAQTMPPLTSIVLSLCFYFSRSGASPFAHVSLFFIKKKRRKLWNKCVCCFYKHNTLAHRRRVQLPLF